ncbi:MAG: deoxynucleoside kinase, partial [Bacteroidia bacterium]|nr:deoxynucleoside kinase [Bacteroidia bacterium]
IAQQYNAKVILEQFADNPFLPKFYKDPERYSFPLELSFLAERYNQLKLVDGTPDLFTSFTIADYFFMKSLIFARNTLPDDEYYLYRQIFNIIYQSLPKPELYVFLHLNTEILLQNIKKRGRDYEQNITKEYLEKIQQGYFDFFKQQPDFRFLIIDTNNIDFVNNDEHYMLIANVIVNREYNKGITMITL